MPSEEAATRLSNGGNTKIGRSDSGHLAVSTSGWVAGLIKPAQRSGWPRDEAAGKPGRAGAYANQRFNLSLTWEGSRKKAKVSNWTWETRPSRIIGGPRES